MICRHPCAVIELVEMKAGIHNTCEIRLKEPFNIQSWSITTVIAMAVLFALFGGCSKKAESVDFAFSPETNYTMRATEVSTLISDSGVTRYRLITDEWLAFEKASNPYWYFPSGIYVEKFDSTFQAEWHVRADTAYNYTNKGEWVLLKNVKITNLQGEKFDSEKIIWNQKDQRIHSDEFIRIEQRDKIITGYGFESNQEMTNYRIFNPQGIFPVPDNRPAPAQTDSSSIIPETPAQP